LEIITKIGDLLDKVAQVVDSAVLVTIVKHDKGISLARHVRFLFYEKRGVELMKKKK